MTPSVTSPSQLAPEDAPGPLSRSHSHTPGLKDCSKCHNAELVPDAAKCLECHAEIAQRFVAGRGFHRDKKDGCASCHQEHRGEDVDLKPLDPKNFDHAETGYKLEGSHARVHSCDRCHRAEISHPRNASRSYLINNSHCLSCHRSPHPGRQDECLACHDRLNWRVDNWRMKKQKYK